MIIDNISNCKKYFPEHPCFEKLFNALSELKAYNEPKRYELDGDKAFINHAAYITKSLEECRFEAHSKYIDVQYVISGSERIDICPAQGLTVTENKMTDSDIAFYEAPGKFVSVTLCKGDFVILFPGEAHRPCVAPDGKSAPVVKSVGKILYR